MFSLGKEAELRANKFSNLGNGWAMINFLQSYDLWISQSAEEQDDQEHEACIERKLQIIPYM